MKKKGKLIIEQNKKGILNYKAVTEDGKTTPIFGIEIPLEYHEKDAEFLLDKGRIIEIIFEDGKRFGVQKMNSRYDNTENSNTMKKANPSQNQTVYAKAPYNFVPLNECVVKVQDAPPFNKYHDNRFTGYIDLIIETLTPLYIRNTVEIGKSDSDFFNVNGQYKISGSSLRGMIRTLVEIVSFGKFHYFDDDRLYYRGLADVSNLKNYYNDKIRNNVEAGYLNYDNREKRFYINPAESINEKQYETFEDTSKEFSYEPQNDGSWKVWTGKVGNRKRNNWIINPPDENARKIELSKEDMSFYKKDKNRNIPIDIIKSAQRGCYIKGNNEKDNNETPVRFNKGVPIFYVKYKDSQNKERIAFGHTRYFRLPYEKTIGDHIPANLKNKDITDFAEAIFGKEEKWASRVFFEDADMMISDPREAFLPEFSPKILASPKPTTFQHYLEQPENANSRNLNHWDSNAKIRGYKLYWHRNTHVESSQAHSSNEGKVIENDTQHTVIRPVKKGVKFKGRIRFENLSQEDLGALLFVLDLPENCYHKLGMGKPLGLGSVKINSELFISYRKGRYTRLFDEKNNFLLSEETRDKKEFIDAFEKYVLNCLSANDKSNVSKLWDTPRLKELKQLLDWSKTTLPGWNEKTRYMEIEHNQNNNEFKKRPILRNPLSY